MRCISRRLLHTFEKPGPGLDGLRSNASIEALCDHTLIICIACDGELFVAASSASDTRIGDAVASRTTPCTLSPSAGASSSAISEPMLCPTSITRSEEHTSELQ